MSIGGIPSENWARFLRGQVHVIGVQDELRVEIDYIVYNIYIYIYTHHNSLAGSTALKVIQHVFKL